MPNIVSQEFIDAIESASGNPPLGDLGQRMAVMEYFWRRYFNGDKLMDVEMDSAPYASDRFWFVAVTDVDENFQKFRVKFNSQKTAISSVTLLGDDSQTEIEIDSLSET